MKNININDIDINLLYDILIDWDLFTSEELDLIIKINGYNLRTLEDCLFVRYGYSLEQFILDNWTDEEDWEDEETEEE